MEVTLQDAAAQLGVSVRQAQRLAAAGTLNVTRWVGHTALVESGSVVAAARTARGAGRRWDARTAWVGQHVTRCTACPNPWRLLEATGRPSTRFRWDDGRDDSVEQVLAGEGVQFVGGTADRLSA